MSSKPTAQTPIGRGFTSLRLLVFSAFLECCVSTSEGRGIPKEECLCGDLQKGVAVDLMACILGDRILSNTSIFFSFCQRTNCTHRRGLAVLSPTSRAALLHKANIMLAAGRSFPAATTVRRASARTASTGRAWRSTPASSPNNNVRGLSSEGTPGTVAGARAAGALRVDAPSRWERRPRSWARIVVALPVVLL